MSMFQKRWIWLSSTHTVTPPPASVPAAVPSSMAPISKLTCLTALMLDEPAISTPMARQLAGLTSLRRLQFSFDVLIPASLEALQDLDFVQDLHLG